MRRVVARLWPRSLAGRLTILLVVALAIAQLALTLILSNRQEAVVAGLMHSQALNETVTLARLLNAYPATEEQRLADAFGSRTSCAVVTPSAPATEPMDAAERQLAETLTAMMHGIRAGSAQVSIEPAANPGFPCENDGDVGGRPGGDRDVHGGRGVQSVVAMSVPLLDGRWLTVKMTAGAPHAFDRTALLSFLLSGLVVAIVAVLAIRLETRSLRSLANASDRFGRGEEVEPLSTSGPSEVAAATTAFNTMQKRLSLFLKDRLRLLASISHDLRTPLTTLRLKAEFIEDETTRDGVIATVDELTTICEATLAFTRAEATSEPTQTVALADLVGEVIKEFRLAGKPVSLDSTSSVRCACRPVALKRALRNLIENAVRYGSEARLSVSSKDDTAMIYVDDHGPGMPPERIEEAFKPFVRLEPSRNMESGGLGLGLAIASSIVKAHGGTLTLANRAEGGLRAEIALPC